LVKVVEINVGIAKGMNEIARLQAHDLGDHVRQQRIQRWYS
jgi:hypothetical protein